MKKIVSQVLSILDRDIKGGFLQIQEDPENEILVDQFEEELVKTFIEFNLEDFLKTKDLYSSWEFFVQSFLQIFYPSIKEKPKITKKIKKEESVVQESFSDEVLKILQDKGLNAKEKIFKLKSLGFSRSKVIEFNFCHWTYVYELWRI